MEDQHIIRGNTHTITLPNLKNRITQAGVGDAVVTVALYDSRHTLVTAFGSAGYLTLTLVPDSFDYRGELPATLVLKPGMYFLRVLATDPDGKKFRDTCRVIVRA